MDLVTSEVIECCEHLDLCIRYHVNMNDCSVATCTCAEHCYNVVTAVGDVVGVYDVSVRVCRCIHDTDKPINGIDTGILVCFVHSVLVLAQRNVVSEATCGSETLSDAVH